MDKRDFLRNCLMGIAASILPKILQPSFFEIEEAPTAITYKVNEQLIRDLQLLTPQWYKSYLEKYGDENFEWWLNTYGEEKL